MFEKLILVFEAVDKRSTRIRIHNMLTDIVWDLGASVVDLRWYVFGALIATAICQDVFNAAYLFWNRPVSPACKAIDLDIET